MSELVQKLGLDVKLLIAQLVNFGIVLVVLRLTVYKPLIKMLHERRAKIERGMEDAIAAKRSREEAESVRSEKLALAEGEALQLLESAQRRGKEVEASMLLAAREKEADILRGAERIAKAKEQEAADSFYSNAATLLCAALAKMASVKPELVDGPLIAQGIEAMRNIRSNSD